MFDSEKLSNDRPSLLTIREACEALRIGRTTLHQLVRAGQIAAVRIGKRAVRIPLTEIERVVREGV